MLSLDASSVAEAPRFYSRMPRTLGNDLLPPRRCALNGPFRDACSQFSATDFAAFRSKEHANANPDSNSYKKSFMTDPPFHFLSDIQAPPTNQNSSRRLHLQFDGTLLRFKGGCSLVFILNDPVHFTPDQNGQTRDVQPQHKNNHGS